MIDKQDDIYKICTHLFDASIDIYKTLKTGHGLSVSETTNQSNDIQIGLDIYADDRFHVHLKKSPLIKYIISEEQPTLNKYNDGAYSVALDPLDGSKSALVGIPSGAIFGIFKNANGISEFCGKNVVAGGFFVFGINLEVYFAYNNKAYKGIFDDVQNDWTFSALPALKKTKMISINASNYSKWEPWLQDYYTRLITEEDDNGKSYNMRWYASMVSEIKRLVIQGGFFTYPNDSRKGYEKGHLRLVYEGIPIAYLIKTLGGDSSNGICSLLETEVTELHQKTSIFLGDADMIKDIEKLKKESKSV